MKTTLRLEGGTQLAARLDTLSTRTAKGVLRSALREGGAPLQRRIESLAPRAPGAPDIAENITMSTAKADAGPSAALAIGPSTAVRTDQPDRRFDKQGKYLEFGTATSPMRAFMRPSFDQTVQQVLVRVRQAIWAGLIARGVGSTRSNPTGGGLL